MFSCTGTRNQFLKKKYLNLKPIEKVEKEEIAFEDEIEKFDTQIKDKNPSVNPENGNIEIELELIANEGYANNLDSSPRKLNTTFNTPSRIKYRRTPITSQSFPSKQFKSDETEGYLLIVILLSLLAIGVVGGIISFIMTVLWIFASASITALLPAVLIGLISAALILITFFIFTLTGGDLSGRLLYSVLSFALAGPILYLVLWLF